MTWGRCIAAGIVLSLLWFSAHVPDHWLAAGELRVTLVFAAGLVAVIGAALGVDKRHEPGR